MELYIENFLKAKWQNINNNEVTNYLITSKGFTYMSGARNGNIYIPFSNN
jgi:hypothetical protein